MGESSEKKKFLNVFDYLLIPFVIAVALVALFKGVFSQIYFFSDLLTIKEILTKNDCYQDFSEVCQMWGNTEKYDYSYRFSVPILNFLFPFPKIEDVNVYILIFEALLVTYVWFRTKKFIEIKRKKA
jgi:hypothetical protein